MTGAICVGSPAVVNDETDNPVSKNKSQPAFFIGLPKIRCEVLSKSGAAEI